jgi:ABC-type multidrug transport system permease subunit
MKVLVMNQSRHILIFSTIVSSIIIIAAVCWHSVEEIHYLKSFFPKQFSVEEAFYASAVELIKVVIVALPFVFIIVTGFCSLYYWKHNS